MNMNRRRFLVSNCSLLGSSSIVNTLFNLELASAAAAEQVESKHYKALVCIFLFGGNDSYNMLIPAERNEYAIYKSSRSNLAIPFPDTSIGSALLLPNPDPNGRAFAVHPAMHELRELYAGKKLAFLANTGTLVEPTTTKAYQNRTSRLPTALFSHNDQREQWQTGIPQLKSRTGWLGRAIDLLEHGGSDRVLSSISLNGNNILQTGRRSTPFAITEKGSVNLVPDFASSLFELFNTEIHKGKGNKDSFFQNEFFQASTTSFEKNAEFVNHYNKTHLPESTQPNSTLAQSLDGVARSILVGKETGLTRQTYFVLVPGWDNHQNLLEDHHYLLRDLSRSLGRFQDTLDSLGLSNEITTFTASDFARTLRSNGRGTDHAWGGNHFVMGGAVNGGTIYGKYPDQLLLNDGLDIGKNGRLLPTTSCDQYFAELLLWFGVPKHSLTDVLPNVGNFSIDSLGFLRQ